MKRPQTLTEKILASHSIGSRSDQLKPGDVIRIKVDWTIASELAWNGMNKTYELLGRPPIYNKERFYLAIDHTVDPVTIVSDPRVQKMLKLSRAFASEASLTHFYDANETIMHTKFYRDLVLPGEVVLGADSHTCSHGGLGAFAIGLGGADITVAMTLGESWIEVPECIAIVYKGELPFGIGGKDVILKTLGTLGRNTVAFERSVEFIGPAVNEFSTDMRFTISNMTAEFGGLNGIFEPDGIVKSWIDNREESKYQGGEY
ncbi:MAG: 3-isopropylmalate dehydratase, partial [candidate division Zixibacteria bacterium]|nr:3-isopropylmalate dehydratase [candidate division Zixibacteria bacterium]